MFYHFNKKRLHYHCFGPDKGTPVILFHGFPGSCTQAKFIKDHALKSNHTVYAFDRPGYGYTTNMDSAEFFTGLKEFCQTLKNKVEFVGVSGGAPYAVSFAQDNPDLVKSLRIICGLAPMREPVIAESFPLPLTMLAKIYLRTKKLPWDRLVKVWQKPVKRNPQKCLEGFAEKILLEQDKKIIKDPSTAEFLIESIKEANRQGPYGIINDIEFFYSNWFIKQFKASFPIEIYHSSQDNIVPVINAHFYANHLIGSKLHLEDHEAHYSLPINLREKLFN